ncbi:MAG: hypothetical protein DRH30_08155 [Deltaproteobacteria bacterium]|nr:MAG: hypothetical protein DRH30_08155 [Deltaproteobacteria bacterium]
MLNELTVARRETALFSTILLVAVVLTSSASASAQQTFVIPAVSDNTLGVNGSVWATEVQIIKKDPQASLTVRRLWVCVPEGGFLEDPGAALVWEMPRRNNARDRLLTLLGDDLLEGTDSSLGAVALVIEGGEAIVNARVADISRGRWLGMTPLGQGQRIPATPDPLTGGSYIPWLGGCRNAPCNLSQAPNWDYFRNNIGLVNPNPEPLVVSGLAIPFGPGDHGEPIEFDLTGLTQETFERTVPPYGWVQFAWVATQYYEFSMWGDWRIPMASFLINLEPDQDLPYFAYASTVFAPDPDSGVPAFNDPMFIPAESGYIAPFTYSP